MTTIDPGARRILTGLAAAAMASCVACADGPATIPADAGAGDAWFDRAVAPPVAERRPHTIERHGRTFVDDYHYLRDRSDPQVIAYMEAESAYARAAMAPAAPLRKTLYDEMAARLAPVHRSEPERDGGYLYHTRHDPDRQYPIHYRKKDVPGAAEEIVLDENVIAGERGFFHLGDLEVSPDGRLAAYTVDTDGSERYTIRIRDLAGGRLLDDRIEGAFEAVEWANDSKTLYYTTIDSTFRPYRLHRHRLGADPAADERLFQEDDLAYYLSLRKTRSGQFLVLHLESVITAEEYLIDAGDPAARPRLIERRRNGTLYAAEHWGDRLYIRTSDLGSPSRLVAAPLADPSRPRWTDVIPQGPDLVIEDVQAFSRHLVLLERREGMREIRILDLPGHAARFPRLPEPIHTIRLLRNPGFDATAVRFAYESPLTPESIYGVDLATGEMRLLRRRDIGGGFDPGRYETTRVHATSADGTRVPILLVQRRGTRPDGRNPLLLYAYGSGNLMVEPGFSPEVMSLLDRGVVYGIAQIRGGGELGRAWAEQARLLNKVTSFTDFIACAEHLAATGYTARDRLAIEGGSAGGLLVGAVVTMRPDLFAAAVAEVPFVDVLNTQEDATLPLVVTGWEEWGDPRRRDHFDVMLSYSPYDNVAARDYPHMLITGGLNDPRVPFWEPVKWTARLRATKTGDRLLLLKMNMGAGHGGASGRYDVLEDAAFKYAFVLKALGVGR
ncbi:MAG: S9 family peptidase [Candidatus Polarisedimenticolia bacterium]